MKILVVTSILLLSLSAQASGAFLLGALMGAILSRQDVSATATATANATAIVNSLDQTMANGLVNKIKECLENLDVPFCEVELQKSTARNLKDFLTLTTKLNSSVTKTGLKIDLRPFVECRKSIDVLASAKAQNIYEGKIYSSHDLLSKEQIKTLCIEQKPVTLEFKNFLVYSGTKEMNGGYKETFYTPESHKNVIELQQLVLKSDVLRGYPVVRQVNIRKSLPKAENVEVEKKEIIDAIVIMAKMPSKI